MWHYLSSASFCSASSKRTQSDLVIDGSHLLTRQSQRSSCQLRSHWCGHWPRCLANRLPTRPKFQTRFFCNRYCLAPDRVAQPKDSAGTQHGTAAPITNTKMNWKAANHYVWKRMCNKGMHHWRLRRIAPIAEVMRIRSPLERLRASLTKLSKHVFDKKIAKVKLSAAHPSPIRVLRRDCQ